MSKSIGLIILNWNNKPDLIECLNSVRKLDPSYKHIPIIIDQGSTDGSVEEIKANFRDCVLVENTENVGACEGYNIGYRKAFELNVDYIFVQDNDTILAPDLFKKLIPKLEGDPRIGIIGPCVLLYDDMETVWCYGGIINWSNFEHIHNFEGEKYQDINTPEFECDFVPACGLLLKREVAEKIGEWDNDFFLYHNDVEYCLRAKKMGYRVLSVPKARMWHKVSSTVKPYSPMMIYYKGRNKMFLFKKYGDKVCIHRFVFSHLIKGVKILSGKNWEIKSIKPLLRAFFHGITNRTGKRDFS